MNARKIPQTRNSPTIPVARQGEKKSPRVKVDGSRERNDLAACMHLFPFSSYFPRVHFLYQQPHFITTTLYSKSHDDKNLLLVTIITRLEDLKTIECIVQFCIINLRNWVYILHSTYLKINSLDSMLSLVFCILSKIFYSNFQIFTFVKRKRV